METGWEEGIERRLWRPSKCWRQFVYYLSGSMKVCWVGMETVNTQITSAALKKGCVLSNR